MVFVMIASALMCFISACVMAKSEARTEEEQRAFEKRKQKAVFVSDLKESQHDQNANRRAQEIELMNAAIN